MKVNRLISLPKFVISNIEHKDAKIFLFASIKSKRSQCPVCGNFSTSVHDHYTRKIMDLSVFQNSTTIFLKTRKFRCKDPLCHRKIFSEQTPHVIRYSRRTARVSAILDKLSIELTGRLGKLLSKELLLPVSTSTMIRMAHKQVIPEINPPTVLGVDDWAFRKGVSYGTILIDMETSRPIDLLTSRESTDLKQWLKKYPDIEIITRDRAGSYSSAISEVCPDAIQIADRFHLLMNLSEALDQYFKSASKEIKSLIKSKTEEITKMTDNGELKIEIPEPVKIDRRIDTFNKVKELQKQGVSTRKIAKDLKINRSTVRSYFIQEILSPRISSRSTNIDSFTKHILIRLNTKGYKIKEIIDEILLLGYNGCRTQAYHNINNIKSEFRINIEDFKGVQQCTIPYIKPLSTRKLAKYIDVHMKDITDPDERNYMELLLDSIPEFRIVRKLVQIFKTMLKRGCGSIAKWIDFIKRSSHKLSGLKTFANGLSRDIKAVENGIKYSWNNGKVEGHVNRIKSIKRQMYGRASFELLKRKVILSQNR